jgi:hypothetical protein
VATKLTQSPTFLKPGKFRQPPFLHWSLERLTAIRSRQLVDAADGDWQAKDVRYAHEGGVPKWLSGLALLSYAGVVLLVIAIVG